MSMTPAEKTLHAGIAYRLHPRLEADSLLIGQLPLCEIRLSNNRYFPWLLLIPQVGDASEIIDLSAAQQQELMREIALVSSAMQKIYQPAKLNVAALGNMVPQLHVHVIARFVDDVAWPNPVWGHASEPYSQDAAEAEILGWRNVLGLTGQGVA